MRIDSFAPVTSTLARVQTGQGKRRVGYSGQTLWSSNGTERSADPARTVFRSGDRKQMFSRVGVAQLFPRFRAGVTCDALKSEHIGLFLTD
jgi:hypothetical protein